MADVSIIGGGNAALAMAAYLSSLDKTVSVWSPSDQAAALKHGVLYAEGKVTGEFRVDVASSFEGAVAAADVLIVAITATGHSALFRRIVTLLTDKHLVLVSCGQLGFGAHYLQMLLNESGKHARVASLTGPLAGGRKLEPNRVIVPWTRKVGLAAIDANQTAAMIEDLKRALGDCFSPVDDAFFLALSQTNAIYHAALALANITRMEGGEEWCGLNHTTRSVAQLSARLDREKRLVAEAFGLTLRTIEDVFAGGESAGRTIDEIVQPLGIGRTFKNGPRSVNSRYIDEEVPFGLVSIERLGAYSGVPTPVTSGTITTLGAMRDTDYRVQNDMFGAVGGAEGLAPGKFSISAIPTLVL